MDHWIIRKSGPVKPSWKKWKGPETNLVPMASTSPSRPLLALINVLPIMTSYVTWVTQRRRPTVIGTAKANNGGHHECNITWIYEKLWDSRYTLLKLFAERYLCAVLCPALMACETEWNVKDPENVNVVRDKFIIICNSVSDRYHTYCIRSSLNMSIVNKELSAGNRL